VGSIPASNHGGRARILYLWWYASPGAAADQPGVQDWYIPYATLLLMLRPYNFFCPQSLHDAYGMQISLVPVFLPIIGTRGKQNTGPRDPTSCVLLVTKFGVCARSTVGEDRYYRRYADATVVSSSEFVNRRFKH
jgi:hypothetical protein